MQTVLGATISAAEKEKLQHARDGYHVFYIVLAVEYVSKYATMNAVITEAVIHSLSNGGRACTPSDGPKDYEVSIEQIVRETEQLHMRKKFAAKNSLTRHEKREHFDNELDDALPPSMRDHKKRRTRARKDTTPPSEVAQGSKRKADDTYDEDRESAKSLLLLLRYSMVELHVRHTWRKR